MKATNKQKRHGLRVARKWLKIKLDLERPFKKELKSYFYQQAKKIERGEEPGSISVYLAKQYKRIVRVITGLKIKQDDDYDLEILVLQFLAGRAEAQSNIIDRTTREKLKIALDIARQDLLDDGIIFPSVAIINKIASRIFRQLNSGRIGSIATTETQALVEKMRDILKKVSDEMMNDAIVNNDEELGHEAAELAESIKAKEVANNIGVVPPSELFAVMAILEKMWVTMGDKKVRNAHKEAAFQVVLYSDPFVVMGELLMHPGDMSMGASIENIANCRCSAVNL